MIDSRALERLKEAVGSDPDDLVEIIESFLEEAPSLLMQMTCALDLGDLGTLQRGAHSLKSNARDLGANSLAGLCQSVEEEIRTRGELPDARVRVLAIVEEWNRVDPALRSEIINIRRA